MKGRIRIFLTSFCVGIFSVSSSPAIEFIPKHIDETAKSCMINNIFFEAREADVEEWKRIYNVTMNRVKSEKFPDNVCEVIYQPYQFSWTLKKFNKKKILENKKDRLAHEEIFHHVSVWMYWGVEDITEGAMFYHAHYVNPLWASKKERTASSDWHKYYRYER